MTCLDLSSRAGSCGVKPNTTPPRQPRQPSDAELTEAEWAEIRTMTAGFRAAIEERANRLEALEGTVNHEALQALWARLCYLKAALAKIDATTVDGGSFVARLTALQGIINGVEDTTKPKPKTALR